MATPDIVFKESPSISSFADYVHHYPLCLADVEWIMKHRHLWSEDAFDLPNKSIIEFIREVAKLYKHSRLSGVYEKLRNDQAGALIPVDFCKGSEPFSASDVSLEFFMENFVEDEKMEQTDHDNAHKMLCDTMANYIVSS